MNNNFPNLFTPIKIGNKIAKNRILCGPSMGNLLQGPESWPTEAVIQHEAKKAKHGAAIVTCSGYGEDPLAGDFGASGPKGQRRTLANHTPAFDIFHTRKQNYLSQLTDAIHFYGSLAFMEVLPMATPGYDISANIPHAPRPGEPVIYDDKEMPVSMMHEICDDLAQVCTVLKDCGFDGIYLHMSYVGAQLARALSARTNKRTDEFGGSLENRCRFPFMACDAIKKACGKDFIIEASITGYDPLPDGWTLEDTTEFMKMAEGHIDIVQLRTNEIDSNHPTGHNPQTHPFTFMAEAAKKAGSSVLVTTIGGNFDPYASEEILANGQADFIGMARGFICNPEYGRVLMDGDPEELVPCIRCNKCFRTSHGDPYVNACSVNPEFGMAHKIHEYIDEVPPKLKKVAIIGGGPAGMEAAQVAAKRGHSVTLFEKEDVLGGQMNIAEIPSFKWPLRKYKQYMIRKTMECGADVRLGVEATPEMITQGGYDAVLVAVGSKPSMPAIPGIETANVMAAADVYNNEESTGKKIVVIGGGEVGVETGMHLCEFGREVTVIEMQDALAKDSPPYHCYSMFQTAWESLPNFHYVLNAACSGVSQGSVTYTDAEGEHTIEADTVIVALGTKALTDEALKFGGLPGVEFHAIGDCERAGSIQRAVRGGYGVASIL